tara:strand:+ start:222 stop:680 length:459 start_codon:yes stop_codon:yes gene_type:complete
MVEGLAEADLSAITNEALAFESLFGQFAAWPQTLDRICIALAIGLLLLVTGRTRPGWSLVSKSTTPIVLIVASAAGVVALMVALHFLRGETPLHPAHELPYLITVFGVPISIGAGMALVLNRRWDTDHFMLGVCWFWAIAGLLLVIFGPGAA